MSLAPATDPRWQALVDRIGTSVFQSAEWIGVLEDTYGFEIRANVALDGGGEPVAGLAYASLGDLMDPRFVSLPFSDFCDPLVEDRTGWDRVAGPLLEDGRALSLRCLHSSVPLSDERLTETSRARWHGIDLNRDPDELWSGLHSAARRSIRKARANDVVVRRADSKEGLRAFFELHLRLRKYKYHLLAQPYRFFEVIWDRFMARDLGALLLAQQGGSVIGGVLFLEWQDTLFYKFNASSSDHLAVRPNDLVVWEGIEFAKSRGLSTFDFGLSDWDQEGLVRYKRKFATDEKTIHFLKRLPAVSPSARESRARALLPELTALLVADSVSDEVTEAAGDLLYRYFT